MESSTNKRAKNANSLRAQGNDLYHDGCDMGMAPVLRRARLHDALDLYKQSLKCSCTIANECAALKNLGMTYRQLFLQSDSASLHASLKFLSMAYDKGVGVQPNEWLQHLLVASLQIISEVALQYKASFKTFQIRIPKLEQIAFDPDVKIIPTARAYLNRLIVEMYLKDAITSKENRDFSFGLRCIAEARRPLTEAITAERTTANTNLSLHDDSMQRYEEYDIDNWIYDVENISTDLDVMQAELVMEEQTLRAKQCIFLGIQYQDLAVNSTDGLVTEYLYQSMDMFREAIVQSRELDMHSEAAAFSYIGTLYTDVLKKPQRGKQEFKRSVQLALSLSPAIDYDEPWFKTAREQLEERQKEFEKLVDDEWSKAKEPFMEEMKLDLDAIVKASKENNEYFLKYVYEHHPPKNTGHSLPETFEKDHQTMKNLFKKGLIHYHFDNSRKLQDTKWSMICEEISKHMSAFYENFK